MLEKKQLDTLDHGPFDVIVLGAGVSGLVTLKALLDQGFRARALDREQEIGGNWYQHRYPGCRNDTCVPTYQYNQPGNKTDFRWSELYPSRDEILRYLHTFVQNFNLRNDIESDTTIIQAHWHQDCRQWQLLDHKGFTWKARFVVACTGYLSEKKLPDFAESSSSPELSFHIKDWPEDLDINGRRVGVVGTGAAGVQLIEEIADTVKNLYIFQRTPNLALPRKQQSLAGLSDADFEAWSMAVADRVLKSKDGSQYFTRHESDSGGYDDASKEEKLLQEGGLALWGVDNLLGDREINNKAYWAWYEHVRPRIESTERQEKLAPQRFRPGFGTKRPCLENRYFELFNSRHVELIDLNQDPIQRLTTEGVETKHGIYPVDVLVYATGYDAILGSLLGIDIVGEDGQSLQSHWSDRVKTYLGMQTTGCPNFFFVNGPQAPTALAISPTLAEFQGRWIADCLTYMKHHNRSVISTVPESEDRWVHSLERSAQHNLIRDSGSWVMRQTNPEGLLESLCYLDGLPSYRNHCEVEAKSAYPGFCMT